MDSGYSAASERTGLSESGPGCSSVNAGGGWVNQGFPDQSKRFHVEFDAVPSNAAVDAVIGLAKGGTTRFTQLAAIVRFNDAGTIDARAGSVYQADSSLAYHKGTTYHVRIDVDPRSQAYSVWVRPPGVDYIAVARNYAFRTEQAGILHLDDLAAEVDSGAGTLQLCDVSLVADPTTADDCLIAVAGDGPIGVPLPDATVLDTVTFTAQADSNDIDAVIGLSAAATQGYSDLAAAVRLAPGGRVDVRDGDSYRADRALSYLTAALPIRVVADMTTHRYSVFASSSGGELARQYRFRTEQSELTHLDHLGVIVDGDHGSVAVCRVAGSSSQRVAYTREGRPTIIPLANDEAMISSVSALDGSSLDRVDAHGRLIETFNRPGVVAAALDGALFHVSTQLDTVIVEKLAPDGQPLWQTSVPVQPSDNHPTLVEALAVDHDGGVAVAVLALEHDVIRANALGAATHQVFASLPGGLLGDGFLSSSAGAAGVQITRFDVDAQVLWQRSFAASATIARLTVDPDDNVLFGGNAAGQPDFGGGPIAPPIPIPDAPLTGYMVKLSSTGEHVFSERLALNDVTDIASNGARIVVAGTHRPALSHVRLLSFDASGASGPSYGSPGWRAGDEDYGTGGSVVMGPTGRVWWTRQMQWPTGALSSGPFVIALEE